MSNGDGLNGHVDDVARPSQCRREEYEEMVGAGAVKPDGGRPNWKTMRAPVAFVRQSCASERATTTCTWTPSDRVVLDFDFEKLCSVCAGKHQRLCVI